MAYTTLNNFLFKPIGLYVNEYGYVVDHLSRNIGNGLLNEPDGFFSPIGSLVDPFYNTEYVAPWFIYDTYKNKYSDYIAYIKGVYGSSFSVTNINTTTDFKLDSKTVDVGILDGDYVNNIIKSKDGEAVNVNGSKTDTKLGILSTMHAKNTLLRSISFNDERNANSYAISSAMRDYFGMNTKAVENDIVNIGSKISSEEGRMSNVSPLNDDSSPVYNSNWGNYKDLGIYKTYFGNTPSGTTQSYIRKNLVENRSNQDYPILNESDSGGHTYLERMGMSAGYYSLGNGNVRYLFNSVTSADTTYSQRTNVVYAEAENNTAPNINGSFNPGIAFGYIRSFTDSTASKGLLKLTNDNFRNSRYDTLIGRFHTKATDTSIDNQVESAVSKKYGASHGRNLLKLTPDKSEGYDNPYCRVWTYHHQYHRLIDTIRPLLNDSEKPITNAEFESKYNFSSFRNMDNSIGLTGGGRLDKYGTKNQYNGLVNMTPVKDGTHNIGIKNCMFSIENLAWKGMFGNGATSYESSGLSDEQKGPFGGRIMWFPPYEIRFNESVVVDWEPTQFIGRGEKIYTYKNTDRNGTLSFKLLIDHPSVLDYWNGRNQTEQNGGVDDVESNEQKLLRFFAGCDLLYAKETPKKESPNTGVTETNNLPETGKLTFFVFFPNNYSGEDDDAKLSMIYLANGIGANYVYSSSAKYNSQNYTPSLTKFYPNSAKSSQIGGYEMRSGCGVSYYLGVTNAYSSGGKTTEARTVYYGDNSQIAIMPEIIADKDLPKSLQRYDKNKKTRWYYRVDNDRGNEALSESNYKDAKSYCLNSGGEREKIISTFDVDGNSLYSFADVFVALEGDNASQVLSGVYNEQNVAKIKKIFETYDISNIEIHGYASSQGIKNAITTTRQTRNDDLSMSRANTIRTWLSGSKYTSTCSKVTCDQSWPKGERSGSVDDINAKIYRSARVDIYFATEEASNTQTTQKEQSGTANTINYNESTGKDETSKTNWEILTAGNINSNSQSNGTVGTPGTVSDSYGDIYGNNKESSYFSGVNVQFGKKEKYNWVNEASKRTGLLSKVDKMIEDIKKTGSNINLKGVYSDSSTDSSASNNSSNNSNTSSTSGGGSGKRYDGEAEFFKLLELKDPMMHHKISEKIKYFDPAFHSISPEGFNARLTFLHQCTRQGPTVGGSDELNKTANNLSFGRPPVCILRIGDFYYTKIVMNSLNIEYEPLLWDLNQEGIGVMPMIANIQIGFSFIGGSNLAGPISRLQNALSFNYYANTEVYDDRAEQVVYGDNSKDTTPISFKTFPY